MKYRCLTDDELKELEADFKQFLIVNGVHAEEWAQLNATNDSKVMELVELFSDIVLDKALKNIKFLEHVTTRDIKAFRCDKEEMVLIGITSTNTHIDFSKDTLDDCKDQLDIFRTTKSYYKSREEEVFQLLESGCSIIDEKQFKALEKVYSYSIKQI